MSTLTAIVIQSVKAMGKENITSQQIDYLRKKLSEEEKSTLLAEGKTTSVWLYSIIKKISEV